MFFSRTRTLPADMKFTQLVTVVGLTLTCACTPEAGDSGGAGSTGSGGSDSSSSGFSYEQHVSPCFSYPTDSSNCHSYCGSLTVEGAPHECSGVPLYECAYAQIGPPDACPVPAPSLGSPCDTPVGLSDTWICLCPKNTDNPCSGQ